MASGAFCSLPSSSHPVFCNRVVAPTMDSGPSTGGSPYGAESGREARAPGYFLPFSVPHRRPTPETLESPIPAPVDSRYSRLMPLCLVGSNILHMDPGTYMWIQLTEFAIDGLAEDRAILAALVRSPGYAHDYASPFDPAAAAPNPAVHGRWRQDSIHPESFRACAVVEAESTLQAWANAQEWMDADVNQSPGTQHQLHSIYALLRSGHLFTLENPGTGDEHEKGFVVGNWGFHEFVVIDRVSHRVHVVVASDD